MKQLVPLVAIVSFLSTACATPAETHAGAGPASPVWVPAKAPAGCEFVDLDDHEATVRGVASDFLTEEEIEKLSSLPFEELVLASFEAIRASDTDLGDRLSNDDLMATLRLALTPPVVCVPQIETASIPSLEGFSSAAQACVADIVASHDALSPRGPALIESVATLQDSEMVAVSFQRPVAQAEIRELAESQGSALLSLSGVVEDFVGNTSLHTTYPIRDAERESPAEAFAAWNVETQSAVAQTAATLSGPDLGSSTSEVDSAALEVAADAIERDGVPVNGLALRSPEGLVDLLVELERIDSVGVYRISQGGYVHAPDHATLLRWADACEIDGVAARAELGASVGLEGN